MRDKGGRRRWTGRAPITSRSTRCRLERHSPSHAEIHGTPIGGSPHRPVCHGASVCRRQSSETRRVRDPRSPLGFLRYDVLRCSRTPPHVSRPAPVQRGLRLSLAVVDHEVVHSVASVCWGVRPLIPMCGWAVFIVAERVRERERAQRTGPSMAVVRRLNRSEFSGDSVI